MKAEDKKDFREQIANELTRDELIDRLCEINEYYQDLKAPHQEEGGTKAVQKQSDDPYHLACQNCGTTEKPLQIIPFRNDNHVVGLLHACDDCKDVLYGQRFDREEKFTLPQISEGEIDRLWDKYCDTAHEAPEWMFKEHFKEAIHQLMKGK